MISVYMGYFPFIRPVFSKLGTTQEYSETYRYVTVPFFHFYLIAIILGINVCILQKPWQLSCSSSIFVSLKDLPSSTV